ncbi:hypothetical protein BDY21DRAFT_420212 [Lineolata rhizophorae]|uniref:Secreted protein n=1 Tax=Lineolata rhizophorae TaxID=578093 RepID=A0A6A6P575_9PEZI|nr:hypothetical protein BDY21DRAFT_420212 [Lineolata rhizophorae]
MAKEKTHARLMALAACRNALFFLLCANGPASIGTFHMASYRDDRKKAFRSTIAKNFPVRLDFCAEEAPAASTLQSRTPCGLSPSAGGGRRGGQLSAARTADPSSRPTYPRAPGIMRSSHGEAAVLR